MKNTLNFFMLMPIIFLLQGCAVISNINDLAPFPSIKEFNTFSSRLPGISNNSVSMGDFKIQLAIYIGEYHARASDRRKMEWDSTGMTSYGGLAAVVGALADRTGLVNAGAGLAGFGLSASARYNFGQQSQVYLTAIRRLTCINSKIVVIPDIVFEDGAGSPDENSASIARASVRQLANMVDSVRIESNNGLLGIMPGTLSRDELLTMLKSYLPSSQVASPGSAAPLAPDVESTRKKEAGEQVKLLLLDVATCLRI